MQLIHHQYSDRVARYFIDGKRVSRTAFDHVVAQARSSGGQHACFLTLRRKAPPGREHYVHYSSISRTRTSARVTEETSRQQTQKGSL